MNADELKEIAVQAHADGGYPRGPFRCAFVRGFKDFAAGVGDNPYTHRLRPDGGIVNNMAFFRAWQDGWRHASTSVGDHERTQ